MAEVVTRVQDEVDRGVVDVTAQYERLNAVIAGLARRVQDRFDLERDPSTDKFEHYGTEPGPTGTLRAYAGPEVDWMIHSWLANPRFSFSNIHLTVWLGPQIKVPHFGLALGTIPQLWCYIDGVPRADLFTDLEHLDTYFEPVNEEHLEVRARETLSPFVSQSLYVRQSLSPTAHCFITDEADDPDAIDLVEKLANNALDRWLGWVDAAEQTDVDERAALAARDLAVRRTVAERDPANVMGVRFFGEETTNELVSALWGGSRELPRPHER